jgi:hypothetical protein
VAANRPDVSPAAQAAAMIYTMLLGGAMMNTALAVSRVPVNFATWTGSLDVHPLIIVAGFLAIFVVLTCVLDELAMMLLLLPVMLPTILVLDLFGLTVEDKAIWFGIPYGGGLGRPHRRRSDWTSSRRPQVAEARCRSAKSTWHYTVPAVRRRAHPTVVHPVTDALGGAPLR